MYPDYDLISHILRTISNFSPDTLASLGMTFLLVYTINKQNTKDFIQILKRRECMRFLKKLKSGNFWVSLISCGVLIAEVVFDFEIKTEYLNQILLGLMGLLTVCGIVTDHGATDTLIANLSTNEDAKQENNQENISNIKSICDTISLMLNKVSINPNTDKGDKAEENGSLNTEKTSSHTETFDNEENNNENIEGEQINKSDANMQEIDSTEFQTESLASQTTLVTQQIELSDSELPTKEVLEQVIDIVNK